MLPAPVVLSALKTGAPGAQFATCSPAEVLKPRTSCKPSLPMPNGFVQSITILPARLPRLLIAASVADQGVAITTTSASLTASAGALMRCLGNAAYFGSAGLRSPPITSPPCLIHSFPRAAPPPPPPPPPIPPRSRAHDGDAHACLPVLPDNQSSIFSAASKRETKNTPETRAGHTSERYECPVEWYANS